MKAFVCVAVLCVSCLAWAAPDASVTKDAAIADAKAEVAKAKDDGEKLGLLVDGLKAAFSNGWRAGIAAVISLLMFFWRRFDTLVLAKIPNKWLPFVVAGVAFLAAIPASLTVEPWSWTTFIWQGLLTGAQAMALWSIVLKHVLKRFLPEGQ